MKYLVPALACLFCLASCGAEQYEYESTDTIELKKDPCFGFCPVYTFKIDGQGRATFTGKRNVEKEGEWSRVFSIQETNALFNAFVENGFWNFDDEYTAQVTDLPTTWVSLSLGGKEKTIKDYYGAPPALKDLEKMAEIMAESETGWVKNETH